MKKVAVIGTVGIPARYGGFETLVHHLTGELKQDFAFTVYCSKNAYQKEERVDHFNGAKLVYLPIDANGVQSVLYDIISIFHALFYADVLLILGVSGGIILPLVRLFTNKKIIVNIDGLEWRRNKWNKTAKAFLKLSERIAVKFSHADITDNEAIKRYTSIKYKTLSHLIEYGGDHTIQESIQDFADKYPFIHSKYAFKVARIEPENNIHLILEAFDKTDKTLVVIGNWNNSEYGRILKKKYKAVENVILLDPIYHQEELDAIRANSEMYLHGHSAGGTNPSLVEAMCLGLPVISYDVSYNRATTEDAACYFKNVCELRNEINQLSNKDLLECGSRMSEIANRRYQWSVIAGKYKRLIYSFDYSYSKQNIHADISFLNRRHLQEEGLAHLITPMYYFQKEES